MIYIYIFVFIFIYLYIYIGVHSSLALPQVQDVLVQNGLRERVTLRVDGGIKTGWDSWALMFSFIASCSGYCGCLDDGGRRVRLWQRSMDTGSKDFKIF